MVKFWCIAIEIVDICIPWCYIHINARRFLFLFKPMLGRFIFLIYGKQSIEFKVLEKGIQVFCDVILLHSNRFRKLQESKLSMVNPAWLIAWRMTHDAWHMTHDAWCMMHDAWCMMHDTWYMIHDTWYMIHDMCYRYCSVQCSSTVQFLKYLQYLCDWYASTGRQ